MERLRSVCGAAHLGDSDRNTRWRFRLPTCCKRYFPRDSRLLFITNSDGYFYLILDSDLEELYVSAALRLHRPSRDAESRCTRDAGRRSGCYSAYLADELKMWVLWTIIICNCNQLFAKHLTQFYLIYIIPQRTWYLSIHTSTSVTLLGYKLSSS